MDRTVDALQEQVNETLLGSDWDTLNDLVASDARIIGPRGFMISRESGSAPTRTAATDRSDSKRRRRRCTITTGPACGSTWSNQSAPITVRPSPADTESARPG